MNQLQALVGRRHGERNGVHERQHAPKGQKSPPLGSALPKAFKSLGRAAPAQLIAFVVVTLVLVVRCTSCIPARLIGSPSLPSFLSFSLFESRPKPRREEKRGGVGGNPDPQAALDPGSVFHDLVVSRPRVVYVVSSSSSVVCTTDGLRPARLIGLFAVGTMSLCRVVFIIYL